MLTEERMSRKVISIPPETSISDALVLLERWSIRHLPVVENEQLIGIISDRDLYAAGIAAEKVEQVMTRNPTTILARTPVDHAAAVMRHNRISSLPVTDASGNLCGIITTSDVLDAFVDLSGASLPSSMVMLGYKRTLTEPEIRAQRVVAHEGGQVRWMQTDTESECPRVRMRFTALDSESVLRGLEREGFEIAGFVGEQKIGGGSAATR